MSRTWVVACTLAEAVGMTAAAAAALAATSLSERDVTGSVALGLGIVVLGGLVEGSALGWLQAAALAHVLGTHGRRRWLLATILVAGFGWAAASAPAALAGDDAGSSPPFAPMIVAAAGLGAAMGVVLGAAQSWAARGCIARPRRWGGASVGGWTAAMPVIFAGASGVGASWDWWLVVLSGTATGAVAGAVLGATTLPFVDRLEPVDHQERRSHEQPSVA